MLCFGAPIPARSGGAGRSGSTASNNTNNTQFLNQGFTNVTGREMMFTLRYIF
jgi:hypothetical protein